MSRRPQRKLPHTGFQRSLIQNGKEERNSPQKKRPRSLEVTAKSRQGPVKQLRIETEKSVKDHQKKKLFFLYTTDRQRENVFLLLFCFYYRLPERETFFTYYRLSEREVFFKYFFFILQIARERKFF